MKVRICPACGRANSFASAICEDEACQEGLLDVPITQSRESDREPRPEPTAQAAPSEAPDGARAALRKCRQCGRILPYRYPRCECGAPMFGPPMAAEPEAPAARCLRSEDGRFQLALAPDADITLGRSAAAAEYLSDRGFVSRRHARIAVWDGNVVLISLSRTNPTLVNGRPLERDRPCLLREGDRIALGAQPEQDDAAGAAYFRLGKTTE